MRQERDVKPDARVLVTQQAGVQSAWLVKTLRDAGYAVHLAADSATALETIRASAEPLIVLLDASNTRFINAVLCSRRLIHHHAYVLVASEQIWLAPTCMATLMRSTLFIMHTPFTRDDLLQMMTQASRYLGSAYPTAPAAENQPEATTEDAQTYSRAGAGGEEPSTPDVHGEPP